MEIVFEVAHKDQAVVNVVLGRRWMGATNCQLDWITRQYVLHVEDTKVSGKSSELEASIVQTQEQSSSNIASMSKMPQPLEEFIWI